MTEGPLAGLEGLRVVDASEDLAGAYCTKLLGDAGATVVKVEPPDGSALRRRTQTGSLGRDGDEDGALWRFLAAGHSSVVADGALDPAGAAGFEDAAVGGFEDAAGHDARVTGGEEAPQGPVLIAVAPEGAGLGAAPQRAPARRLQLDDGRAGVAQQLGAVGAGQILAGVEDPQALEPRERPLRHEGPTSWRRRGP